MRTNRSVAFTPRGGTCCARSVDDAGDPGTSVSRRRRTAHAAAVVGDEFARSRGIEAKGVLSSHPAPSADVRQLLDQAIQFRVAGVRIEPLSPLASQELDSIGHRG
jgi:hypothetical protein